VTPKRFCVYWANLDPVIGSEISKTRPVVVVSDDMMNRNLNTVVLCPLTTSLHPKWRSRIQISLKGKQSEIAIDQIRTISIRRLGDQLGNLSTAEALKVRILITEMFGES
jgi:mRNA interferase MazF